MTDIDKALVERLRWGGWYFDHPYDGNAYASDDPLEAADRIEAQAAEIERLKAEAKNAWCDDALPCRQLMDAKQEIERLREAGDNLGFYAGHEDACDCVKGWAKGPCNCGYTEAWQAWSAALGETK